MSEEIVSAEVTEAPADAEGGGTVLTDAEATTQADDKIAEEKTEAADDSSVQTDTPENEDELNAEIDLSAVELPEGFELDTALAEQATPVFKDLGLNQDQAAGLMNLFAEIRTNEMEAATSALTERQSGWRDAIKEEWGGDFDKNVAVASKAVVQFGGDELRSALEETGAGDHPAIIKFFHQVGSKLSEDAMVGETGKANPSSKTPLEKRLYTSMKG